MSLSHHDREEETLIAYFQQMLAEVDDLEFSDDDSVATATSAETKHQTNEEVMSSANAAIASVHHNKDVVTNPFGGMDRISTNDMISQEINITDDNEGIDNPLSLEPEVQLQPEAEVAVQSKPLAYAQPTDSLQRLLSSVEVVAEPKVETQKKTEEVAVAAATEVETKVEPKVETKVETAVATPAPVVETVVATAKEAVTTQEQFKTPAQAAEARMAAKIERINSEWKNVDLGENFQALFFLVQGVRFAVPLIDLGGIFECDKITSIFGKPEWFMGITDVRGTKINIVDTLRWVMPEIGEGPDSYPYLISLGTSHWSIGCDVLEGNRSLTAKQVKWREIPGSRPWLAGIVTSDKCALLHVRALISLFEAGAGIEDLVRDVKKATKE